jgi:hypothetical protein
MRSVGLSLGILLMFLIQPGAGARDIRAEWSS